MRLENKVATGAGHLGGSGFISATMTSNVPEKILEMMKEENAKFVSGAVPSVGGGLVILRGEI